MLRPREVYQRLGISYWVREGKIGVIKIAGGEYRISESEVKRIIEGTSTSREVRVVIYARVNSLDRRATWGKQIQYLNSTVSLRGIELLTC